MMNKLLQGDALRQRAEKLGVNTRTRITASSSEGKASEAMLQERVINAEAHTRQNRLWIITIISTVIALAAATGSVVSALCAYYALHHVLH